MNFTGFLSYIPSIPFYHLVNSSSAITLVIGGNRLGKGAMAIMDFLLRLFRIHPIPHKNFHDNMQCRVIRFIAETLPSKVEDNESSRNTIYPELIKRLPPELIAKDISAKRPVMVIQDPYSSQHFYIEFSSFSQDTQAQAGVERLYIYMDEIPPYSVFEENYARLITTGGDMIITLTPASGDADWIYELLYEKARHIYRTKPVVDRYLFHGENKSLYELYSDNNDITVVHGATDDNPYIYDLYIKERKDNQTYNDYISSRFYMLDDEITIDVRRYGIFRYVSGRVFQEFTPSIHSINLYNYFPEGTIPDTYRHFRSIDYHESNDWACIWGALSPTNEIFIYDELRISPKTNTIYDICDAIARKSRDYRYSIDLIDPRAQIKSVTTATSPCEDMNRYFYQLKQSCIGKGAYFRSFDTTTTKGRDEIRKRLKNSITCKRPFSNTTIDHPSLRYLPTLWVSHTCKFTIESLRNWAYETWKDRSALLVKDPKEKPQQKFSHFCTALEGAMKENILTIPPSTFIRPPTTKYASPTLFKGVRV